MSVYRSCDIQDIKAVVEMYCQEYATHIKK